MNLVEVFVRYLHFFFKCPEFLLDLSFEFGCFVMSFRGVILEGSVQFLFRFKLDEAQTWGGYRNFVFIDETLVVGHAIFFCDAEVKSENEFLDEADSVKKISN